MRVPWLGLLLAGLTSACSEESVCEEAVDKLESCDLDRISREQGFVRLPLAISADECSGTNECLAKCVSSATCADILHAEKGGSTDPNEPPAPGGSSFIGCVEACQQ